MAVFKLRWLPNEIVAAYREATRKLIVGLSDRQYEALNILVVRALKTAIGNIQRMEVARNLTKYVKDLPRIQRAKFWLVLNKYLREFSVWLLHHCKEYTTITLNSYVCACQFTRKNGVLVRGRKTTIRVWTCRKAQLDEVFEYQKTLAPVLTA